MEFIIQNLAEAKQIMREAEAKLEKEGIISVAEFCKIARVDSDVVEKHENCRGWDDFGDYTIRIHDYNTTTAAIILPEPMPLRDILAKRLHNPVDHPQHYQSETGLEAIDVIEAFTFDLKGIEATDTGNILKYMCRWKQKNGLQDLKKAQWYLNHLIEHVEKLEKENEQ